MDLSVPDIMIDLETFDVLPTSSIAQIAAVSKSESLYHTVNDPGGSFDVRTIRWHLSQSSNSAGKTREEVPLEWSLQELTRMMENHVAGVEGAVRIWSDLSFDIPILVMAYHRVGMEVPWHRRNIRDRRTMYERGGGRKRVFNPTPHNAFADAKAQMEELQIIQRRIQQWTMPK